MTIKAETNARVSALALAKALRELLDADAEFRAMIQEPTFAWRQAEARVRQARIDARYALDG